MRKHSEEFKTKIKEFGRQLNSILVIGEKQESFSKIYDIDDPNGEPKVNIVGKTIKYDPSVLIFEDINFLIEYNRNNILECADYSDANNICFIGFADYINMKYLIGNSFTIKNDNFSSQTLETYKDSIFLIIANNNFQAQEKELIILYDIKEQIEYQDSFIAKYNYKINENSDRAYREAYEIYIESFSYKAPNILSNEELNSVTPVLRSSMLKSVMKEIDIDSNVDIPIGTIINYKFGVLLDSGEYEYLDYGNYKVYSSEKQEDTNSYNIIAYDKMLNAMIEYKGLKDSSKTFPMEVREYLNSLFEDIGIEFADKNAFFSNSDKRIPSDPYVGLGYTYRDIFDEFSQVVGGNIIINEEDKAKIKYIYDTDDTIDEEYLKDINVKFGEKYGPINSIVLSRSAGADNIYIQDEESIEKNGLCELKISDNQIMNNDDRDTYLVGLYKSLIGIEFYINDFSSTGICYYEIADKYNVKIGENIYPCVMFNDEANITQGLEENIYTDLPEQAETDYTKADKTDRKINRTTLIVDKQNQTIQSLVSQNNEQEEKISQVTQTAQGIMTEVSKKVGNDEIISKINQSAEQIQILANKISLEGKEINLTSDKITIDSANLNITENGDLTCNSAHIKGVFENYSGDNIAIRIERQTINFYDWKEKSALSGQIGSIHTTFSDGSKAIGFAAWKESDNIFLIGNSINEGENIDSIMEFSPKYDLPWVKNTVTTDLTINTPSEYMQDIVIHIVNGFITGYDYVMKARSILKTTNINNKILKNKNDDNVIYNTELIRKI